MVRENLREVVTAVEESMSIKRPSINLSFVYISLNEIFSLCVLRVSRT
jgi:hypothetical protein